MARRAYQMSIAIVAVTAVPATNPTQAEMMATLVVGLISAGSGRMGSGGGSSQGMATSSRTVCCGPEGPSTDQPSGTATSNRVGGSSLACCSAMGGSLVVGRAMHPHRPGAGLVAHRGNFEIARARRQILSYR